jgi:hypothetical protein
MSTISPVTAAGRYVTSSGLVFGHIMFEINARRSQACRVVSMVQIGMRLSTVVLYCVYVRECRVPLTLWFNDNPFCIAKTIPSVAPFRNFCSWKSINRHWGAYGAHEKGRLHVICCSVENIYFFKRSVHQRIICLYWNCDLFANEIICNFCGGFFTSRSCNFGLAAVICSYKQTVCWSGKNVCILLLIAVILINLWLMLQSGNEILNLI